MTKQHIKEIDVLRVMGFIFVVVQHVLGGFAFREGASFSDSLILSFFYVMAKPAVPIFVTIAAMMMVYKNKEPVNWSQFYKKKMLYIALPYVIWTVLNILDGMQYGNVSFAHFPGQLLAGTGRYHLWYMSMMLRIYLYFPLILFLIDIISRKGKAFKGVFLIFYILFYAFLLANNSFTDLEGQLIFTHPTDNELKFLARTPWLWSLYVVLGAYMILGYSTFKKWLEHFQKQIWIAYVPLLLYNYYVEISNNIPGHAVKMNYLNELFFVLFVVSSILVFYDLACQIADRESKLYYKISEYANYSYAAYLAHVIILQALYKFYTSFFSVKSFLDTAVLLFLLTVILTFKAMKWLSLLPFSEYFLGTKMKYKIKWIRKREHSLSA
ncbi:acyltransferase [Desulfitobacterium sp. Sab5]|uniref:acyltransferase n=1 Tax=Desulfitobacterium nosdiversum TaxID=3375356 RepID=UPI003CF371F0